MSDYIADLSGPDAAPIESLDQLIEHFERGARPREDFRIGTEYEKVAVDRETGAAIPFSGDRGVERILRDLADRFGWEPQEEAGRVIGLSRPGGEITLEPGGQIELSGRECETLHEAQAELDEHVNEITVVAEPLGVAFLGLGIQPFSKLDEIEWVPKRRYRIMAPYMQKVGSYGQRMMKQTATVQVNLDYHSEQDAMKKMRISTALAPVMNAIFANSPVCDGRPSGFLSFRGQIWTDTDASRCGMLPFLFSPQAGFEDYCDWALDAPMYFVKRGRDYHDLTGVPFRQFWKEGVGDLHATVGDFALHLSTLFPETRLKTYIELRMADSQPPESMLALSALSKGILYEDDCMEGAWDLVKGWSFEDRVETLHRTYREGFRALAGHHKVGDLARELVAIASEGLRRQGRKNAAGDTEEIYLDSVRDRVDTGITIAEGFLADWERNAEADDVRWLMDSSAYRNPAE
ncbi:MAG: glutamate--cysteine ligase [Candidatus Binatia bacterium]|nr:glutamate--cysteine ligase [Candidatus Binatia bacterium]